MQIPVIESLVQGACLCLQEPDVDRKLLLIDLVGNKLKDDFPVNNGNFKPPGNSRPGIPERPVLVSSNELPRRGTGSDKNRIALIHSLAHIEFNAINLALDAVVRFRDMPDKYYTDWFNIAVEEKKHFCLLRNYLNSKEHDYGDLNAHDDLWQLAEKTSHDLLLRLALVPRTMEARGLDVTPGMINKFRHIQDLDMVEILETIYLDEIGHVNTGTFWFRFVCGRRNLDADKTFLDIVAGQLKSMPQVSINYDARSKAGFSDRELEFIGNFNEGTGG